jgi:hypothetical protein
MLRVLILWLTFNHAVAFKHYVKHKLFSLEKAVRAVLAPR